MGADAAYAKGSVICHAVQSPLCSHALLLALPFMSQQSSSHAQASHIKQHVPAFAYQRSGFLRAMSDAGLKPTVVHHNLTPAELYEQVHIHLTL